MYLVQNAVQAIIMQFTIISLKNKIVKVFLKIFLFYCKKMHFLNFIYKNTGKAKIFALPATCIYYNKMKKSKLYDVLILGRKPFFV